MRNTLLARSVVLIVFAFWRIGTMSQNLSTLAMDKEYKIKRARRKDARGTRSTSSLPLFLGLIFVFFSRVFVVVGTDSAILAYEINVYFLRFSPAMLGFVLYVV